MIMVSRGYGGFHKREVPENGWFVMEKTIYQWMKTGGTPISGKIQIFHDLMIYMIEHVLGRIMINLWMGFCLTVFFAI